MKPAFVPQSQLGRWSVGLNVLFLLVIAVSLLLVTKLDVLSFDDRWWDVTVPAMLVLSTCALITGGVALQKHKDRSVLVYLSVLTGICVLLFGIFHSLFIGD